jgi:hypothetical protein
MGNMPTNIAKNTAIAVFEQAKTLSQEERAKFSQLWEEHLRDLEIPRAIERGLEAKAKGLGRPADEVFEHLIKKHNIFGEDNEI